jgi:hypothetical protein
MSLYLLIYFAVAFIVLLFGAIRCGRVQSNLGYALARAIFWPITAVLLVVGLIFLFLGTLLG